MNYWVERSIRLANNDNYLDRLLSVYPVHLDNPQKVGHQGYKTLTVAFKQHNRKEVLKALLKLERFPVDDPYVGFLRKDGSAIDRNPKTVKRITNRLFKFGINELIGGIEQAKSPSRRFGQLFRIYLQKLGYPIVQEKEFRKRRIAILQGSDASLKKFAMRELGYRGDKGLDLILKVKNQVFIGETKFVSRSGGTQDKSFREAMSFVRKQGGLAKRIIILDGVVWLTRNKQGRRHANLYSNLLKLKGDQLAMSALLLHDFITSIYRKSQS